MTAQQTWPARLAKVRTMVASACIIGTTALMALGPARPAHAAYSESCLYWLRWANGYPTNSYLQDKAAYHCGW